MRNPKQDPAVGDVLKKAHAVRVVMRVVDHGFGYFTVHYGRSALENAPYSQCYRAAWERWAKDAEVVEVGDR